jgi:hypothetical protein
MVTAQWETRIKGRAAEIMLPHSGVGGCAPIPKKLKPAADKIAPARDRVAITIMGFRELGRMCRKIIRASDDPMASAALT